MVTWLLTVLLLSLASASTSITISHSRIFEAPRNLLGKQCDWLKYFINCPYCISHWVSAILCGYKFGLSIDMFIATMATVTLASIWCVALLYFFLLLNTLDED